MSRTRAAQLTASLTHPTQSGRLQLQSLVSNLNDKVELALLWGMLGLSLTFPPLPRPLP